MTAFNYARTKASADRLIAKFGQLGAIRRAGEGSGPTYDPTPGADVDHPCRFVVLDYENSEVDGTRVLATDKKVLLAVGDLAITPKTSDLLVDGPGSSYRIIPPLKPLSPGGVVLFYEIQARR